MASTRPATTHFAWAPRFHCEQLACWRRSLRIEDYAYTSNTVSSSVRVPRKAIKLGKRMVKDKDWMRHTVIKIPNVQPRHLSSYKHQCSRRSLIRPTITAYLKNVTRVNGLHYIRSERHTRNFKIAIWLNKAHILGSVDVNSRVHKPISWSIFRSD